jgi:hypothetical protein
MIIALSGKINSGKTTVSDIFKEHNFIIDSFAKSVKDICCIIFGYDREKIEGNNKEDRLWRETIDINISKLLGYSFTPRDAMIKVGTDFGRNMIHPNIWIESLFNRYNNQSNILITDLRFVNEYNEIKKKGGIVIRINRPNTSNNHNNHTSECELDNYIFDYIIDNNGTIEELKEKVINIIKNLI